MKMVQTEASPQIFSVSGLNYKIKHELRSLFPQIQVKGEVSGLKKQASGHVYFTLKDSGAQLSCALFRSQASGLALPKEGDQIVASGQIDVYPPRGSYQLIVNHIKQEGLGDLLVQLEELKIKLKALGWFEKKRPLPPFPKKIGVVSSPTGAVIRDICHVLQRRAKGFDLLLNPVAVQGEACPKEVAEAIAFFNAFKSVDVIIVARGGGSIEDLWGFNSEIVAKAIYESEIPVISAVGHETDTTIADLAADVRAPTPSAAAEIVMKESAMLIEKLSDIKRHLAAHLRQKIERRKIALERFAKHPLMQTQQLLGDFFQRLDASSDLLIRQGHTLVEKRRGQLEISRRQLLALKPSAQVVFIRQKLQRVAYSLRQQPTQLLTRRVEKLRGLERQLNTAMYRVIERHKTALKVRCEKLIDRDPRAILKKGYAIVFSQNKESIILSAKDLKAQKTAWVRHSDGETEVTIL